MEIKVCGIRSVDEATLLKDLEIDYFGIIFAKSQRKVDLKTAIKIADIFKKNNKKIVALFTKQEENIIFEVLENINFDVIQLHDSFDLNFCKKLQNIYKNTQIWRVFSVLDTLGLEYKSFLDENFLPLFDTKGKLKGGNGEKFNWDILKVLPKKSFIIAGGLGEDNCLEAMKLNPKALDFNSKVETNNQKDIKKIKNIIKLIKGNT